ncbi:MAG: thymidylate kinase [Endomicrobiales bacterium]|jgi:dTMP kinase
MSTETFTGIKLPRFDHADLIGKLIVVEGTDGVGRSTQTREIKEWLEIKGYAVKVTGIARSPLISRVIEQAKSGHSLNVHTFSLLYLADFADCLEHEIIPALKAGYIVLADRYVYTMLARGIVRGADRDWMNKCFGFALVPDAVFYLRVGIKDLIPRILNSANLEEGYWIKSTDGVMDYWESGMDMKLGGDFYDSFVKYQKRIIREFDAMATSFKFTTIDASRDFETVNTRLKKHIDQILVEPPSQNL